MSQEVVVKDIYMIFGSIVVFLIMWFIGGFGGMILLGLMGGLFGLLFGGLFAGLAALMST